MAPRVKTKGVRPIGAKQEAKEQKCLELSSKRESLNDYCPGDLLARLLLPQTHCPAPSKASDRDSDGGSTRSRSRSRSRSPSKCRDRSLSPQPKKMPRALRRMMGVPEEETQAVEPPPAPARPKVTLKAAMRKGPVLTPGLQVRKLSENGPNAERLAMETLARHAARLGQSATGLEVAVREALRRSIASAGARPWDFLERQDGMAAYEAIKWGFIQIFDRTGRNVAGDREVIACSSTSAHSTIPSGSDTCDIRSPTRLNSSVLGSLVELRIDDVRFAHNDQSERFGRGRESERAGGILQLVVELLAGLTSPSDVPEFNVCWHEGHWFCRSGNRRLAAFRLAQRLAPSRFGRIRVRAVPTDDVFIHGASGRRPKLTTMQNGEHCNGRWLLIRETGEAVGTGRPNSVEYGMDLLSLIPFSQ